MPRCATETTASGSPGDGFDELDPDALVDATLRLVADDLDPADLSGVGDVGPAIGLEIQPDDLDRPDLGDARREEVDLRSDEIGDGERLVARQDVDLDLA